MVYALLGSGFVDCIAVSIARNEAPTGPMPRCDHPLDHCSQLSMVGLGQEQPQLSAKEEA